ncbi:protein translocase subunit SecF [Microvirga sp. W0021]|uniref:Protein-export membrane protein SecF n=1 Tax=Hohaiivirga grylli TaxID=3133970 RepID=A0ABV0BM61_9HYPH
MRLLRIWPDNTKIHFMGLRHFSFPLSAIMSIATIVLFFTVGLNFGVDFKGGTLIEIQAHSGVADMAKLRTTTTNFGFGEVEVQGFGNSGGVSIKFKSQPGGEEAQKVVVQTARAALEADYDFRRVESVGPRVSGELVQSGTIGIIVAVVAVLMYLWFRFERELALGAIVGTLHDIVLTVGFFMITRIEFNMTSIAAILTIVGYSLNETVVVFDRTRELMRKYKAIPTVELLDISINHTMSRTVMTAITTSLSLLALVLFGGEAIHGFAMVMLAGVIICTYSAICISTPSLIYIGLKLSGQKDKAVAGA